MRTVWRVVLPIVVGAAVLVVATVLPVTRVRGDVGSGPSAAGYVRPSWHDHPIDVRWADGHRRIAVDVRWSRRCPPALLGSSSTAPARVEVRIRLDLAAACQRTDLTTYVLHVPTATVAEPGQGVLVLVDGTRFDLPHYRR